MSSLEEYSNKMNQNIINNINIQDLAKSKNIDLCLMEKDKEIINLSNQTTSLKNNKRERYGNKHVKIRYIIYK